ncbi:hypothetical protein GCM10027271_56890 [Saccharopolyspora gloriosae]|uniref:Pycsar effector protein domain-containing protein n=1 Tax=Saccharopolyspora gloriosae TaxID=455344 RepID=A0A840NBP4_9PSEU|nr:Pycsar system effector family protein [Saccharopolyspora gloriosae]MBB5067773.1 hypothetical protein [Saccharopolyspora gloriosae]
MPREQLATIDRTTPDHATPTRVGLRQDGPDAPEPGGHLTAEQELEVALRTAGDFRSSIAGADTKAGLLISALGICIGGASKAISAPPALSDAASKFTSLALLAVSLCAALGALLYLTSALTPRTRVPSGRPNLFAFPTFQRHSAAQLHTATTVELCAQAWQQAETLAGIAGTKYRRLRNALRCFCTALLAFLLWTGLLLFLPAAGS